MITEKIINTLPHTIGIYLFKKGDEYVYIGKSLSIRERVHNHFEKALYDPKEKAIIENSDRIDHVICSSELHALVLESHLIQKYHPPYNVIWKDDKSYLYIKIPLKDAFPRISLVRREQDGISLYFGPFSSTKDVRFLLRAIRRIIPFCTQKQPIKKPCFYSKIGLCNPCPGGEHSIQIQNIYRTHIKKIIDLLEGKTKTLLDDLNKMIIREAKQEHYEQALELRNRLLHLEQLIHLRSFEQFEYSNAYDPEKALQKLFSLLKSASLLPESLSRIECYDISNLMQKDATASMVVATNGILDKAEYKRFKIQETGVSDFKMLSEALTRRMSNDWKKPNLIIIDGGAPQVATIRGVLNQLHVKIPLIGIAKHPDRIVVDAKGEIKTYKFSLHNEGFKLIQQLRDESHRFAKKYHKYLRGKKFSRTDLLQ
ncbi:MAG: GIY-YIG nuclease family protein [bacterium]